MEIYSRWAQQKQNINDCQEVVKIPSKSNNNIIIGYRDNDPM